jgi:hypothetical protein
VSRVWRTLPRAPLDLRRSALHQQAREEAARAGADHDRPRGRVLRRADRQAIGGIGRRHDARVAAPPAEDLALIDRLDVEVVDEGCRPPLAGIDAAPEDREAGELLRLNTQRRDSGARGWAA